MAGGSSNEFIRQRARILNSKFFLKLRYAPNYPQANISSPLLINCRAALQTARWLEAIDATYIAHMGTYNCRKQRGGGLVSEHSYANGIDVLEINGANLKKNWRKGNAKSEYLLSTQKRACKYFNNVVGPDDNKAHEDHFHLDLGPGVGCLPLWAKRLKESIIVNLKAVF